MQGNEDEAVRTLEESLELTLYMLKGDYTRGRSLLEQALAMFKPWRTRRVLLLRFTLLPS